MNHIKKCSGVVVPMITPVTNNLHLDEPAVKKVINHLTSSGCTPFVLGTTGEATSLSSQQKKRLVQVSVEFCDKKTPLYVGIASNCFEESVQLANDSFDMGASYVVAHLPFYYPLTTEQMRVYFIKLADSIKGPLLMYNIPATTGISMPIELVLELSEHENIVGFKDSERDLHKQETIISFCKDNESFAHFTGWGGQIGNSLLKGSDGLVPSTGNIVPGLYQQLYLASKTGNTSEVERLQLETDAISEIYQKGRVLSESLAALKVMMHELGLCGRDVLPPLTFIPDDNQKQIINQMHELNVSKLAEQITSN